MEDRAITLREYYIGMAICGYAERARDANDAAGIAERAVNLADAVIARLDRDRPRQPIESSGEVRTGEAVEHSRPDLDKT